MLAYRLTDHLSDLNTNVSQEAVDVFIQKKAFRKRDNLAVYNGIDLSRFVPDRSLGENLRKELGVGSDDFVFFNAGRLTAAKDQDNLLRSFFPQLPHGQLWIAGEGELRDELTSTIAALGIQERVKLLGARIRYDPVLQCRRLFRLEFSMGRIRASCWRKPWHAACRL